MRWLSALAILLFGIGAGAGPIEARQVVVTREFLTPARINPFQYGQFIEHLCNLVPGMWAEKLYDGSFEGLSPYKFAYLKETYFREKPWYPAGATNRVLHTVDRTSKVSGESSLKIVAPESVLCTGGVAQDGIAVERGVACDFSSTFTPASPRFEYRFPPLSLTVLRWIIRTK